jgi:cytochrome c oxidase subunit 2
MDHLLDSEKLDELRRYEYPLLMSRNMLLRILLTRRDVLHSLGIPSLGIKLDSAPGRLNSVIVESKRAGLFTGSCYELCGRGHRAMPIFIILL